MRSRIIPSLTLIALLAGPVGAEPDAGEGARFGVGVVAGVINAGVDNGESVMGDSRGLNLELVLGSFAAARLEVGEANLGGLFERRDRRIALAASLDLTRPLPLFGPLSLTPVVEAGAGFTGSEFFADGDYDWRLHGEVGAGLRLRFGSRLAVSGRVQAGMRETSMPEEIFTLDTVGDAVAGFVPVGMRERYNRWQVAALLYF